MDISLPKVLPEKQIHIDRYKRFIETRPKRNLKREEGFNVHHIVPRSLGGLDNDNLIKLTIREHYIAHLILWKCGYKEMVNAFWLMQHDRKDYKTVISARQYKSLQEKRSSLLSVLNKGKGNPMFGKKQSEDTKNKIRVIQTGRKISEETKEKISKAGLGRVVSKETKLKISEALSGENCFWFGKNHTEDTKQKLSEYFSGKNNPMYGKIRTKEEKEKIRKAIKKSKKVRCLETGETFDSIRHAAFEKFGNRESRGSINYSLKHHKSSGGFTWELIDA
jgi:hypothetical protein